MRPALGVGHIGPRPGVAGIGLIAVAEQRAGEARGEHRVHLRRGPRGCVVEGDLIGLAIDRPEVGLAHLALGLAPGLDRGLVHRQHAAGEDVLELRVVDRAQQLDGPARQPRERAAAQLHPRLGEALMLAIQRQVVGELIDQHPGQEAHIDEDFARARSPAPACCSAPRSPDA